MTWIKLDDDTYALEATPDPKNIVSDEMLHKIVNDKLAEIARLDREMIHLSSNKEAILIEIDEINNLLGE